MVNKAEGDLRGVVCGLNGVQEGKARARAGARARARARAGLVVCSGPSVSKAI